MDRPMKALNWGCGPAIARNVAPRGFVALDFGTGWINSDIVDYGQEHVGSILAGLPWDDGFFDGVVANHSLQCLPLLGRETALRELHRVLRPGGRLRVLIPDVVTAFIAYEAGDESWAGFAAISEPWSLDRKFAHYLTWGGQNRLCYTPQALTEVLEDAGFVLSSEWWAQNHAGMTGANHDWAWLSELDSRPFESIVVEVVACT